MSLTSWAKRSPSNTSAIALTLIAVIGLNVYYRDRPNSSLESANNVSSESSASIVEKLRNAIAGQESGHDPSAVNPHSNALGYGQVMPENVRPWVKQCKGIDVTEDQFLKDKKLQVEIIDCKLAEYLAEFKNDPLEIRVKKVAAKWYAGDGNLYLNTKPQKYGAGDYPSISDYANNVWERFKKQ